MKWVLVETQWRFDSCKRCKSKETFQGQSKVSQTENDGRARAPGAWRHCSGRGGKTNFINCFSSLLEFLDLKSCWNIWRQCVIWSLAPACLVSCGEEMTWANKTFCPDLNLPTRKTTNYRMPQTQPASPAAFGRAGGRFRRPGGRRWWSGR